MREINEELGCRPMVIPTAQPGYAEYMDKELETQRPDDRTGTSASVSLALGRQQTRETDGEGDNVDQRLQSVAKRLKEEFGDDEDGDGDEDPAVGNAEQEAISEARLTDGDNEEENDEDKAGDPVDRRPSLRLTEGADVPSGSSSGSSTPQEKEISAGSAEPEKSDSSPSPTAAQPSPPAQAAKRPFCPRNTTASHSHKHGPHRCIRSLRHVFDSFAADQHNILSHALISGRLHGSDDSLRIAEPMPSLRETYDYRYVPSSMMDAEGKIRRRARKRRRRHWMDVGGGEASYAGSGAETPVATPVSATGRGFQRGGEGDADEEEFYEILRVKSEKEKRSDEVSTASHHSLTRVYSFVFAME